MMATLKDNLYPSQRELAVEQLAGLNWHQHPQVVDSIMTAAKDDPAATVRAACVHALAQMQVNTAQVAALMQTLQDDREFCVRQEATEALKTLGVASAPRQDSAVSQASHK
jgi:HEAT repeat protein